MAQEKKPTYRILVWTGGVLLAFFTPLIVVWLTTVPHEPDSVLNGESARNAAIRGGDYLVRHFDTQTGTFDYAFDAETGATSTTYNLLRHAGTTYALLELYGETGEARYLSTAERALEFLLTQEQPCPPPRKELMCLYEEGSVKLGGSGLAVLALTEHVRVTDTTTHLQDAERLAVWMLSTQAPSGEFTVHIQNADGTLDDHVSLYYPGEALFGLMRLYTLTKDERYHDSARAAAHWLVSVRDGGKTTAELEHDHWLLYGLRELTAQQPEEKLTEHARRITDAIASIQHASTTDPRWVGGFYNPPRSTPTATRVEGLSAAYELYRTVGDEVYRAKSLGIMREGVAFVLRTQVDEARRTREGFSEASLGGFTGELDDTEIRIDYVQHAISALLGYRRALEEPAKVR